MKRTPDHLFRRSIRSYLATRPWLEPYAWLLAGLLLALLVDRGGEGFTPGSLWDMCLGLFALAAVRTGLVGWLLILTGRDR